MVLVLWFIWYQQLFFQKKIFKKSKKLKLSGCLYSDNLRYSLKFGVKFCLYCIKYVGVVVCTGVLTKVSYVAIFFIRACRCAGMRM